MKRWKLEVANRQTGISENITVEADNESDAVKRAGDQGYLVSSATAEATVLPYRTPVKDPLPEPPLPNLTSPKTLNERKRDLSFLTGSEMSAYYVLQIFAAGLHLFGWINLMGFGIGKVMARFETDNAFGAIANAAEEAHRIDGLRNSLLAIIAAVLFQVVYHLIELKGSLRRGFESNQMAALMKGR